MKSKIQKCKKSINGKHGWEWCQTRPPMFEFERIIPNEQKCKYCQLWKGDGNVKYFCY